MDETGEALLRVLVRERDELRAAVEELLREIYQDKTWQTKTTMALVLKVARLVGDTKRSEHPK